MRESKLKEVPRSKRKSEDQSEGETKRKDEVIMRREQWRKNEKRRQWKKTGGEEGRGRRSWENSNNLRCQGRSDRGKKRMKWKEGL